MDSKSIYSISIVYQLGLSVVIPLLISIGGGVWLDKTFSSSPKFTVGGIIIGLYLAAVDVAYILRPLLRSQKTSSKKKVNGAAKTDNDPSKK
jgi:F0F1-type ATP synthase assembly protein I